MAIFLLTRIPTKPHLLYRHWLELAVFLRQDWLNHSDSVYVANHRAGGGSDIVRLGKE